MYSYAIKLDLKKTDDAVAEAKGVIGECQRNMQAKI
jgi:hypothetical protein